MELGPGRPIPLLKVGDVFVLQTCTQDSRAQANRPDLFFHLFVGFKGNLALLDMCLFLPGGLSKCKVSFLNLVRFSHGPKR